MRYLLLGLTATALLAGAGLAPDDTGAEVATGAPNEAAGSTKRVGPTAGASVAVVRPSRLEEGANSFTEAQARARLERAGLAGISELAEDKRGIWRGRAVRDGAPVNVGFDYKGDIAAQ